MLKALIALVNKARILMWVLLIAGVIALVTMQVQKKLATAQENLRSLETTEEITYPVTTQRIELGTWETWRSYYGQAKSAHTQNVTTYEREIVRDVKVDVGSPVKAGQTVITLQVADRGAKVQAGRTAYDEAMLNYNRLKELHAKGGISKSEVDAAYARVKSAQATLSSSQSTLQHTELKASINGIVAFRNVEPGEVAEPTKVLISIVNPDEMEAELLVSKKDIPRINKNTPVEIYVDGQKSTGLVKRTSPEAQSGSGLYPVVVGLNANSGILPGSYLEGRFMVARQENVIIIPSNVILYRGDTQTVYIANGNTARSVVITTGEGRDGRVVVTSGLNVGDDLIISGNRVLYDGVSIARNMDFGEDQP